MIWQAWAILVLVGVSAAYLAFVPKEAPVITSIAATGALSVAALGARDLTVVRDTSDPFTTTEAGIAVLCGLGAIVSSIVFLAAVTGQYPPDVDDEDTPTGGVETSAGRSDSFLDKIVRRMS